MSAGRRRLFKASLGGAKVVGPGLGEGLKVSEFRGFGFKAWGFRA